MIGKHISLNGKLITPKKAVLPIDHIEFTYGFGVYENLKLRKNKLYFVSDHVKRLFNSAKHIDLKHEYKQKEVEIWIKNLIAQNKLVSTPEGVAPSKLENANIKMLLIGGKETLLYIFELTPLYIEKKLYKQGIKVITKKYERFLPQVKSLNMLPSYLIYRETKQKGGYDALLIDDKNNILEGTRSNFFVIKNKTLYTPAVNKVLAGVTRDTVIKCAKESGYKVIEKDIKLKNIFNYDGAFLTSTSAKILPIRQIDDKKFDSITKNLKELIKLYNEYLKNI